MTHRKATEQSDSGKTGTVIRILCLHIAENQASYRYRVEQFLPGWEAFGIELVPLCITGKSYLEKLKIALDSSKFDYVWLQRKPLPRLFTMLISLRSKLVYDYDDALYAKESYRDRKPRPTQPGSKQTIRRLETVLKHSDIVFAGSSALAAYARKFNPDNTFIVPTAYEKVSNPPYHARANGAVTIGWIGNVGNLFYLSMIDEATSAIQERYPNVRFWVMSGRAPEGLRTRWDYAPWSKAAEDAWLRSIDIGIMPLVDDEWSRGKCAFKLLQYMAYGKPVIASAVGANIQAVRDGISGFLASTPSQWESALEKLVASQDLRTAMGRESLNHFLATFERQRVQEQIATILHNHSHSCHLKKTFF